MEVYKPKAQTVAEGHYHLTVSSAPTKKKIGEKGYTMYTVEFLIHGSPQIVSFNFMAWEMEPLLLACEFKKEEDGSIQWEPNDMPGKEIECDVVYQVSKKDPTKVYKKLVNIVQKLPF